MMTCREVARYRFINFGSLCFALVLAIRPAFAGMTNIPPGYKLQQSIELNAKISGVAGFLQILEDARLTPAMRKKIWGIAGHDPSFALSPSEFAHIAPELRNAHLRLVNGAGKVLVDDSFDVGLAQIKTVFLYGTRFPTYLVTSDYSIGMGSYAGPFTELVEISDGRLRYLESAEDMKTDQPHISLAMTLKTHWRIVPDHDGIKKIEAVSCRPNFKNPDVNANEFIVTYSTYRFDGAAWHHLSRREMGFWEYDGPKSWPARDKFP